MDEGFYLEKLKIHERLVEVETKLDTVCSKLDNFISKHDTVIFGNGTPGLRVKVDRLEQVEKMRSWHYRTIWAGLSGLLLKAGLDLFHQKPH